HLVVVGEDRRLAGRVSLGKLLRPAAVDVAEGGQIHVLQPCQYRSMTVGDPAAADQSRAKLLHLVFSPCPSSSDDRSGSRASPVHSPPSRKPAGGPAGSHPKPCIAIR